jgi:NADPH2:quinone reductase
MSVLTKRSPATTRVKAAKLPETMQAAAIDRFGGPDVLTIHTLPLPAIDANEALIELDTSGVGIWDAEMRAGWSPGGEVRFPLVLGTDGAGTIMSVGARVRRLKIGDRVYSDSFANPKGGFYAEYAAVVAEKVALIPKGLDLKHAGAIPTTGLTALQGIDDALRVKKGEAVIIHGASGGVGTLAVQFAKLRGARVLASALGGDGVALVRRLGADAAVDGRSEDLAAAVQSFAPGGIDAVLALAGGRAIEQCLDAVRAGGRLAYPNGVEPEPKKRRGIDVIPYGAFSGVREFERLNRQLRQPGFRSRLRHRTHWLTPPSHERLKVGHVLGKIVLRIG